MTTKCLYCGVTYSIKAYGKCPFKCPWFGSAAGLYGNLQGLNSAGLTAAGLGYGSLLSQQQALDAYKETRRLVGENKPITLEDLRKDILRLQTLVIHLQDLITAQGKQISELEEDARPMPPKCEKCEGRGCITMVGSSLVAQHVCPACRGEEIP